MDLKSHTVKSYDKDIQSISATIDDMLNLSVESIEMVEHLLKKPHEGFVDRITAHDYKINSLDNLIEKKVTSMLALRQPMAVDLRYVISSLRVSGSLERIGDQAKSVIKKISKLADHTIENDIKNSLLKMLEISKVMVRNSVYAFNNHDLEKSKIVLEQDDKIDDIYREMFAILDNSNIDTKKMRLMINILFIAKSLERLADHATEIAGITNYVITGEIIENS